MNPNPAPATPAQAGNAIVKTIAQGGAAANAGVNAPPPPAPITPQAFLNSVQAQIVNNLKNFQPASVPTPTPAPFTAATAPAPNPLMFNPTAVTPGVPGMTGAAADGARMLQALEQQTTSMAKAGKLGGMPNYGQLWSGLASTQNALNNSAFTPRDQSAAAGQASQMANQAAISANSLAQRQTQEFNSEQAAAQRMTAMLMNSGNIARLNATPGLANSLMPLLTAGIMAKKNQ